MAKIIQLVRIDEDKYLFIIGYDEDKSILTFRTSMIPSHLQKEKVFIKDMNVYTNLYFFNVGYLTKFLNEVKQ